MPITEDYNKDHRVENTAPTITSFAEIAGNPLPGDEQCRGEEEGTPGTNYRAGYITWKTFCRILVNAFYFNFPAIYASMFNSFRSEPDQTDKEVFDTFSAICIKIWKALLGCGAVLLPASITQLQAVGMSSISTYTMVLVSLSCYLISFVQATTLIVCLHAMRPAAQCQLWLEQAQAQRHNRIAWNPWVILSLPAILATWGFTFFIISVIMFAWGSGPAASPGSAPTYGPFSIPHIVMAGVLTIGVGLLLSTLFTWRTYVVAARDDAVDLEIMGLTCEATVPDPCIPGTPSTPSST